MTRSVGLEGEALARSHLEGRGMKIVATNYRFMRGEIDIVAREGEVLVFCEVKARDNDAFGPPECAITQRKQRQIRKVAEGYLYEHRIADQICRFDVVTVRFGGTMPIVNHIKNAF